MPVVASEPKGLWGNGGRKGFGGRSWRLFRHPASLPLAQPVLLQGLQRRRRRQPTGHLGGCLAGTDPTPPRAPSTVDRGALGAGRGLGEVQGGLGWRQGWFLGLMGTPTLTQGSASC